MWTQGKYVDPKGFILQKSRGEYKLQTSFDNAIYCFVFFHKTNPFTLPSPLPMSNRIDLAGT